MGLSVSVSRVSMEMKSVAEEINPLSLVLHTNIGMIGALENILTKNEQLNSYADIIFRAFKDSTLLFPTFNYSFLKTGHYVVREDPCQVGALNEQIRKNFPDARSYTPVFNYCIRNNQAFSFQTIPSNVFGKDSIFRQMVSNRAWIGFLGSDFDANTFIHFVEEMAGIGYRYMKRFRGVVELPDKKIQTEIFYRVRPLYEGAVDYNWEKLEKDLFERGILRIFPIGLGKLLLFYAEDLLNHWMKEIGKDEWFLLTETSKEILKSLIRSHIYPFEWVEMEGIGAALPDS